jgi:hypothetical protein
MLRKERKGRNPTPDRWVFPVFALTPPIQFAIENLLVYAAITRGAFLCLPVHPA